MAIDDVRRCRCRETHEDEIAKIAAAMPDDDEVFDLAELFKAFGDSTRMRILFALLATSTCVCDLAEALALTPSAISHQLRFLQRARLVRGRRRGKQVVYSLADDHVRTIVSQGRDHFEEFARARPKPAAAGRKNA